MRIQPCAVRSGERCVPVDADRCVDVCIQPSTVVINERVSDDLCYRMPAAVPYTGPGVRAQGLSRPKISKKSRPSSTKGTQLPSAPQKRSRGKGFQPGPVILTGAHGVRMEVLEGCQEVVEDKGNARELAMWDNMGEGAKLAHVVGGKTWAGEAVEKGWREVAARVWVQSGQEVLDYFERANEGFEEEVRGLLG